MNVTTQMSVASPAIAAIVNPNLDDLTVIVLGLVAIVAIIVDSVNQCRHTITPTEEHNDTGN